MTNINALDNLQQLEQRLRQEIERNPSCPEAFFTLGLVCKSTRREEEAARLFAQAIKLKADYPEAYNSLALALCTLNRPEEARACLCRAIELLPDYAEAYNNLGIVQVRLKQAEEAVDSFEQAVQLDPENPHGLNNLGLAFYDLERYEEAWENFSLSIEKNPAFAEAHYNQGRALKRMKHTAESIPCFRRAIDIRPDYLPAYDKLAVALIITNQFEAAEACLRQAIAIKPDYASAHRKLGRVLKMMHRIEEAETSYLQAIRIGDPDEEEDSLFGLGILYLLRGKYNLGWEYYDLRRSLYNYPEPEIPHWRGEDLTGRSILLFCEQGFGDTLQFVRYALMVAPLAGKTDVRVQKPLQRLISASLPDCTIYSGVVRPSDFYDFACSLHSLPFIFQSTEAAIARQTPYLAPPPEVVEKWRIILHRFEKVRQYRIGVVWAGNPKHHNDHNRSIPFTLFRQLFSLQPVTWVSLQVGSRAYDLQPTPAGVFDASPKLADYAETAGLIENLDLVITVDSSVAHVAGSMGKKTWLLLPYAPDWRWQLDRDDSPWYQSVRLFRQQKIDGWPEVLQRIRDELVASLS